MKITLFILEIALIVFTLVKIGKYLFNFIPNSLFTLKNIALGGYILMLLGAMSCGICSIFFKTQILLIIISYSVLVIGGILFIISLFSKMISEIKGLKIKK